MNDVLLFLTGPVLIIACVVIANVIESVRTDCKHDFSEWHSYPDEHAYVQQKQCKKCQFVFTYQERKIGHEQSRMDK